MVAKNPVLLWLEVFQRAISLLDHLLTAKVATIFYKSVPSCIL